MLDDEFEWDDRKAARNFRDHRVTSETARLAFDDPDSINRGSRPGRRALQPPLQV
jgi:uncharacterized DUF497 family protein